MAVGYTNSVPLGREGTGAATILGPNRALQYWLGVSQRDQDRLLREQQAYQQRQSSYSDQFGKDLASISQRIGAAPLWQNEFNALTQGLTDQGARLRAQGVNPYNPAVGDSQRQVLGQWQGDLNQLLSYRQNADQLRKGIQSELQKVSKNPQNYRQSDIQKLIDFEKNVTFDDFLAGRAQVPVVSEKIDFAREFAKDPFRATTTTQEIKRLPDNREEIVTTTKLDEPRAYAYIDSVFRPGTPEASEVEARLEEAGFDRNFAGLAGTVNRDELRSLIDAELRADTEWNPVIDLMAAGAVPALDTPEYNAFLNEAVDEQLKAEKILDQAKREAFNGLSSRVPESEKKSYDSSYVNNMRAAAREARARESHATSQRRANLSIQKLQQSINSGAMDNYTGEEFDLEHETQDANGNTVVYGVIDATPIKSSGVDVVGVKGFDMDLGEVTSEKFRGNITAVGLAVFDSKGNQLPGEASSYTGRTDVTYKPVAVLTDKRGPRTYPVNSIPENLPAPTKKAFDSAVKRANSQAKTLNSNKPTPAATKAKTPAELMREAAQRK